MKDSDLGDLDWEEDGWAGEINLTSEVPFELFIFARANETANREITSGARRAIRWFRDNETTCRLYAADQLLEIHNSEWSDTGNTSKEQFIQSLSPESLVIHESGYAEIGFHAGDLFCGHVVEVRRRANGNFQEACLGG